MSKQEKEFSTEGTQGSAHIEEQAKEQTGQMQLRVHIEEKDLKTSYANGFRPIPGAEEIALDFGLNLPVFSKTQNKERNIVFQANNRIIMNYYATKRLAITLSQIVRRYEQEFGVLELNAAKRRSVQKK